MRASTDLRMIAAATVIYALAVLAFTGVGLLASTPGSQTGSLRTLNSIPGHLLLLCLFGISLGLLGSLAARRVHLGMIVLIPTLVVVTDLDHLPSALGIAQPIRPAHSFVFIVAVVAVMAMTIRRGDLEAATVSAFFAHLTVDTGEFAPFAPFSFSYFGLSNYKVELAAVAVASAVVAGLIAKSGLTRHGAASGEVEGPAS